MKPTNISFLFFEDILPRTKVMGENTKSCNYKSLIANTKSCDAMVMNNSLNNTACYQWLCQALQPSTAVENGRYCVHVLVHQFGNIFACIDKWGEVP